MPLGIISMAMASLGMAPTVWRLGVQRPCLDSQKSLVCRRAYHTNNCHANQITNTHAIKYPNNHSTVRRGIKWLKPSGC